MAAWLRLGTRGSPLALAQARLARERIAVVHAIADTEIELVAIKTSGDVILDRALAEAGGKGLFTKELDAALAAGAIDIAVHSAKDLPTRLPPGIDIVGCLPREDACDVFISAKAASLAALPRGARLGTASLRREALARRVRPDLAVSLLRGNVETRLGKVERGEIDATILALAGLKRLGLAARATALLEVDEFVPAVGQGAIAVTIREADAKTRAAMAAVVDEDTGVALTCERAFLAVLDGSCRTPIGGHARLEGGRLHFRGIVLRQDGTDAWEASFTAPGAEAERMGVAAGRDILGRIPPDILRP
ncbi:MAG: hydroxymethylbilane synthase [Methylobacteriaceae bacterium]|nr:hydroxymethylbilane synthase [Methylobacteriaceae bacterium]MBV9637506.1 hydroxymethylbilane synthase [Methylobacteriaceae bacterium]